NKRPKTEHKHKNKKRQPIEPHEFLTIDGSKFTVKRAKEPNYNPPPTHVQFYNRHQEPQPQISEDEKFLRLLFTIENTEQLKSLITKSHKTVDTEAYNLANQERVLQKVGNRILALQDQGKWMVEIPPPQPEP